MLLLPYRERFFISLFNQNRAKFSYALIAALVLRSKLVSCVRFSSILKAARDKVSYLMGNLVLTNFLNARAASWLLNATKDCRKVLMVF